MARTNLRLRLLLHVQSPLCVARVVCSTFLLQIITS